MTASRGGKRKLSSQRRVRQDDTISKSVSISDNRESSADSGLGSSPRRSVSASPALSPSPSLVIPYPTEDDPLFPYVQDVDLEKMYGSYTSKTWIPDDLLWKHRLIVEYGAAFGVEQHQVFDDNLSHDWNDNDKEWVVLAVIAKQKGANGWYAVAWGDGIYSHPNWVRLVKEEDLAGSPDALSLFHSRSSAVSSIRVRGGDGAAKWRVPTASEYLPYEWAYMAARSCFQLTQCILQMMEEQLLYKIEEAAYPDVSPIFVVDLFREPKPLTDRTCRLPFGVKTRTAETTWQQATAKNNLRVKILNEMKYSPAALNAIRTATDKRRRLDVSCGCAHGKTQFTPPKSQLVIVEGRLWYSDSRGKLINPEEHINEVLIECHEGCGCKASACTNRVLQGGRRVCISLVYEGPRLGWGVRAAEDIPPWTYVGEYLGEVRCLSEVGDEEDSTYFFDMMRDDSCEQLFIDATNAGNYTRFFNHSCDATMCVVPVIVERDGYFHHHIAFFTKRRVVSGEPLTFLYTPAGSGVGMKNGKRVMKDSLVCRCRSDQCRGYVW